MRRLHAENRLSAFGAAYQIFLAPAAQPVEADITENTQQAELIDGKAIAQTIRKEVAAEVVKLREMYGKVLYGCLGFTAVCSYFLTNTCMLLTEPRLSSGTGRQQEGF